MKRITKPIKKPIQSSQVPATCAMLYEMEERLGSKIDSAKFDLKSELHRVALLVEEQNARNKFVMDGYAQVYELLIKKTTIT